jgi:hypothetical protein
MGSKIKEKSPVVTGKKINRDSTLLFLRKASIGDPPVSLNLNKLEFHGRVKK